MPKCSTRDAAKKLGLGLATLNLHIANGRIRAPKVTTVGGVRVRLWSEADIEKVRKILPKIANGRKTRYKKKKRSRQSLRAPLTGPLRVK